jgi:hypothetical protein
MTPDMLRQKMEDLRDYIRDAEEKVSAGTMVNLQGLEKTVSEICRYATSLPPDQARDVQPLMAELIGELERLSIALKDYKNGLLN